MYRDRTAAGEFLICPLNLQLLKTIWERDVREVFEVIVLQVPIRYQYTTVHATKLVSVIVT